MNRKKFRITRREFIWGAAGTLLTLLLSQLAKIQSRFSVRKGYSVHQGYTSKTSTIITVLRGQIQNVQYSVLTVGSSMTTTAIKIKTTTQNGSSVDQLTIEGLQVGFQYTLEISEDGKVLDQREFKTLDTVRRNVRIAVVSCTADEWRVDQAAMWKSLFSTKPDLIYALGDNIYVDGSSWGWGVLWPVRPSVDRIWRRYTEMRMNLDLYWQRKLTPMMAVWDDHDFGFNGADSQFEHKEYVKNVFEIFFPRPTKNENFESGPGLSMVWNAFKTRFIFLDSRSYRISGNDPMIRTQWGAEQKQWLISQLSNSADPIWLLNGSQFIGGDPENLQNDSVAMQHPEDLEWLRQQINKNPQNVILVSGDMHYSEVVKMPKDWGHCFFEVTSSALHAVPTAPSASRDRLALATENNFIILQTLYSSLNSTCIEATCYGEAPEPLFKLTMAHT